MIVDHKMKTIPQKYIEGTVDFFGKRVMSLLGCMIMFQEERMNKKEKKKKAGLVKVHFDIMFDGYSTQNIL